MAKIAAFNPEVLLVEKVVSGLAQEFLFNLGITLVLNVRPSVMDRVSRCCQADIVPSIDAHITRPRLGSCRLFHVETMALDSRTTKTFMFFDGCQPRLGSTLLLRGGTHCELRKVKKVVKFMIFACYNARLERAFLSDEFAIPKALGTVPEIFEQSPAPTDDVPTSSPVPDNNISVEGNAATAAVQVVQVESSIGETCSHDSSAGSNETFDTVAEDMAASAKK